MELVANNVNPKAITTRAGKSDQKKKPGCHPNKLVRILNSVKKIKIAVVTIENTSLLFSLVNNNIDRWSFVLSINTPSDISDSWFVQIISRF